MIGPSLSVGSWKNTKTTADYLPGESVADYVGDNSVAVDYLPLVELPVDYSKIR